MHRWVGLALALPLIILALTGLIMAADPFVAVLAGNPAANRLLTAPDDLPDVDVVATLTAAKSAVAADLVPVRWRARPGALVAVDFAVPGHQQAIAQVIVDTRQTTVMSVRRNPDGFYRWVHSLHETLLLGPMGRGIVGWIGVGLLLLTLSGLPIWWPARRRWKSGFTISRTATGWLFQRQLHGAAGIWLLLLLVLQSVSGMAMAFPELARAAVGLPVDNVRAKRSAAAEVTFDPVHAMAVGVAAARKAVPMAALQDLRVPAVPGRPMAAFLRPSGYWEGSPTALVFMDPVTATVLLVQDPRTVSWGASLLNWLRALHEGGAAGPVGRAGACLFGLALPLFPLTGITMWVLRRRSSVTRRPRAARQPTIKGI